MVDSLFKEDYVFSVIPAGRVGPRSGGYEGILENIKVKYDLQAQVSALLVKLKKSILKKTKFLSACLIFIL